MKTYDEYNSNEIDKALDNFFHEKADQIDYDILKSVCDFAKRNSCSATKQTTE